MSWIAFAPVSNFANTFYGEGAAAWYFILFFITFYFVQVFYDLHAVHNTCRILCYVGWTSFWTSFRYSYCRYINSLYV